MNLTTYTQIIFLASFVSKDPTVWLGGARLTPKYIFNNNMNLTNYTQIIFLASFVGQGVSVRILLFG
jgi:hypothetical protein